MATCQALAQTLVTNSDAIVVESKDTLLITAFKSFVTNAMESDIKSMTVELILVRNAGNAEEQGIVT